MKTEDSNKLIAEFLGYIPKDTPGNKVYQHNLARISQAVWDRIIMENPDNFTDYFDLSLAEYHKSWNWLMPVVEKIEAMGYIFAIVCNETGITCSRSSGLERPNIDLKAESKLDATYQSVVQFIQWYNQNH